MTDSSIIQDARDVLAKWRQDPSSASAWEIFDTSGFGKDLAAGDRGYLGSIDDDTDARLIVGTAGNPELLDAIDKMLDYANGQASPQNYLIPLARRIATAIVAANGRMSA